MLASYQNKIEAAIQTLILQMGEKSRLRDACEYALNSGGKRLRPLLVLMIADALGFGLDVMAAALSVECFHTASLIADDLPCMDNDNERRGRPSLHCVFEESIALLASYTFIASGYEGIYKNGEILKKDSRFKEGANEATLACLEIATRCAGIKGATGGQFLDLFPPDGKWETLEKIIVQKTVTLFQIAFVFGWLFGGGNVTSLKQVEETAYHLGMAFQIADDLQDEEQDGKQSNITCALGRSFAFDRFQEEMGKFETGLKNLGLWNKNFEKVAGYLYKLAPA